MDGPALALRDVTKRYGEAATGRPAALNGVTLDVPPGRVVAIVGRSGSGKSTLLHLAAGIDLPSSGTVRIAGRDLARLTDRERSLLRRDTIGLVFQFFHLLPHLTVRDNVALPDLVAGSRGADRDARVRELLDRVGLGDRADDAVQKLSGGEMQRVAICRALLRRPQLLLADEPTGNLDDANSQVVMQLMLALAREHGSALVFVTHSRDIAALADETHLLHSGILEPA
jgi:ABC-type lipoprotein export system ATPase subunit